VANGREELLGGVSSADAEARPEYVADRYALSVVLLLVCKSRTKVTTAIERFKFLQDKEVAQVAMADEALNLRDVVSICDESVGSKMLSLLATEYDFVERASS